MSDYSTNQRAEVIMGRRPEGVAFDLPCELGYECPVCRHPARMGDDFDERLHWSEYNGFLWCEVCDRDYPSALCVPINMPSEPRPGWWIAGPEAAIKVFLDTVEQATARRERAED